jgi:uncharacterized repeat protein (TIGR03803 family)
MKAARFGLGFAVVGGLAVALSATSPVMAGPTLKTIARFDYDPGADPESGVTVIGARLFGVTAGGGGFDAANPHGLGIVYSLPIAGGSYTTLDGFNGYTGISPDSNLTAVGNTLYGTSQQGGYGPGAANGTIFSISTAPGGSLTNLATFHGQIGPTEGALTAVGNTLYGVAQGGAYGDGVLYSLPTSGGNIHTVLNFNGVNTDIQPYGPLLAVGDTLYGTTGGGYAGNGTVYSYNLGTDTYTTLGTFNGANGKNPYEGVILSGNTLYGTTTEGGANNDGTVFSVPLSGGPITSLASFAANEGLYSGLTLVGSVLYGTQGYSGHGTVFSVPTSGGGGAPKTVVTFNGVNGAEPSAEAGLTLVGDTLYGTTSSDGSPQFGTAADPGYGTVFSLTPDSVAVLSKVALTGFGREVGSVSVVSPNGGPGIGHLGFSTTPTGFVALNDPNTADDLYTFALHVVDSAPDSLQADLADAVWELNSAQYDGFDLIASMRDPHINPLDAVGSPGGDYDLFITIRETAGGAGSPYFGFDFTQLIGTDDTLEVDELAVSATAAVPEPTTWAMLSLGFLGLGGMARRGRKMSLAV